MPTYEYVCRECGQHLEVVQSFTDDPLDTCGQCGGPLRKVFSAAGIIFKGSGYYVTDSRRDKRAAARTSSGATDSAGDPSGDSSSDGASASGDTSTSDAKSA